MNGPAGTVVWITGLPRSGKSSLARAVAARLRDRGVSYAMLDGDEVRAAMVPAPGYDEPGRASFYETLARLAALLAAQGLVVLVPATAHRRAFRRAARAAAPRFIEVHVTTDAAVCRTRDGGRLYSDESSRAALPGAGVEYELPEHPDVRATGGDDTAAVDAVLISLQRPS